MKWKTPKAGPLRLSLSAMQVGNICGIDFMAHGPQVCHCEEAVGRRGNFGKALPIGTDHHQNATRQLRLPMALIERPVQGHSNEEGTGAPQHHPDVSLRGAKRRGALSAKREEVPLGCNLAEPGWITGHFRRKRNCLPEIATSACGLLAMTNRRLLPF